MKGQLTHRQELFAQYFALSGNGTQAALQAGCRNPNSAHVTAFRWLQKATIQERIEGLRADAFHGLRRRIIDALRQAILAGLQTNRAYRQSKRALRIIEQLGIFKREIELRDYIRDLEERCGKPIEEIVAAAEEAEDRAEWEEYRAEQNKNAAIEMKYPL